MNCLATTGTDAVLPFLIGALLVCVGIVVVAIAVRRKRAGLALAIVLLLGLGAGAGSLLDAPAPAQAACVSDPGGAPAGGASGGGTPCTPASAIADVVGTARAEWAAGQPAGSTDLPLDAGSALAWQSALDAINALGTPTFANGSVAGSDGTNSESEVIAESGFTGASGEVPANAAYVHTTDFAAATQGLINPTVAVSFDLHYPDGCGGTLTTHFTANGAFTNTAPCVPAVKVPDFAVGSNGVWEPVGGTLVGVGLSGADLITWNAGFAAVHAIDPTPTTVDDTFRRTGNPTGNPSAWGFTGAAGTPPNTVTVPADSYNAQIIGQTDGGTLVESFALIYPDGCGNNLETDVSVTGVFLPIIG
jgi:hypothetical protein